MGTTGIWLRGGLGLARLDATPLPSFVADASLSRLTRLTAFCTRSSGSSSKQNGTMPNLSR